MRYFFKIRNALHLLWNIHFVEMLAFSGGGVIKFSFSIEKDRWRGEFNVVSSRYVFLN